MTFTVYLKKDEGNQISDVLNIGIKTFNVTTLEISNGLLKKGDYHIPIDHILFIREV